jgi:DHA1 family bicyclomycin/chloramphenicol resistance-like MFS transporter
MLYFFNFNGYWNCGSVGRSFWLPHTHEPDTSISLKPKPIILNFERDERTSVLYVCFYDDFLWFVYVCCPYSIYGCFKVIKPGWIFAFMSLSLFSASQLNSC